MKKKNCSRIAQFPAPDLLQDVHNANYKHI